MERSGEGLGMRRGERARRAFLYFCAMRYAGFSTPSGEIFAVSSMSFEQSHWRTVGFGGGFCRCSRAGRSDQLRMVHYARQLGSQEVFAVVMCARAGRSLVLLSRRRFSHAGGGFCSYGSACHALEKLHEGTHSGLHCEEGFRVSIALFCSMVRVAMSAGFYVETNTERSRRYSQSVFRVEMNVISSKHCKCHFVGHTSLERVARRRKRRNFGKLTSVRQFTELAILGLAQKPGPQIWHCGTTYYV